jgi:hypothetical protein
MKRGWVSAAVVASFALVPWGASLFEAPVLREPSELARHVITLAAESDRGAESPVYRESLAFVREHAPSAVELVREVVLNEEGSFQAWHLTYLLGQFGDASGIAALRELLDRPIAPPRGEPDPSRHELDIRHAESVATRIQAVMSIGQIASHRPELRPDAIGALVEIGNEHPMFVSSAIYELRKLLGEDADLLRDLFGSEHAREFERLIPPPRWQRLLADRIQERQRRSSQREGFEALCGID